LLPDLIKSTHPAFRPVDVKMGPDGALYIADWYNPIIQHGEVDFRDPRRDHTRGRIWRVTAKGRKLVPRPKLAGAKTAELLAALKEPEGWTRRHARLVLKERGKKAVLPALKEWTAKLDARKPADEAHLLEALWTYQALDVVEPKLLRTLLGARDYRVRAAATRVLSAWRTRVDNPLGLLSARVADDEPQVRLEAVRALGQIPKVRSAELALRVLERPTDTYLDYGLWLTMRELELHWLPALHKGKLNYGNVRRLAFALQAVGSARVVKPLADLVRAGKLPADSEDGILVLLAGVGGPGELALVLDRAVAVKSSAARRLRLLGALVESAQQRGSKPSGDLGRLVVLLKKAEDDRVKAAAARLAGLWGLESARPVLLASARDGKASEALRRAAIDGLASLGGKESRTALDELAARGEPPAIRRKALVALAGVDLAAAARRAVEVLSAASDGEGAAEVFDAFLQRKNGGVQLAKAVAGKKLPADVAKVGVRTVRISGRPDGGLLDALVKAGSLKFGARRLSADELKKMVADVARSGDAARGERIFRRADQLCLKCHAVGGAGGQVGPDLSSIGATAQVDYLIESLLEPSKAIKENYHALLVSTSKGQLFTGIKVRQTRTALILRTDQDKELAIPLKDIEEQTPSKTSLMPDGLTDTLTCGELLDLVRFLSELGKVGPYAVGKARVARRWQALESTPATLQLLRKDGMSAAAGSDPALSWASAYSTVAGSLPLADVPALVVKEESKVSVLRCQVEASAAAKVALKLNDRKGVTLWLDGKAVVVKDKMGLKLTAGLHTLTLAVEVKGRKEVLRCEVEDTPGAAGVRFVAGK
jgi:putative heme-binding domain-containing protein